MNINFHTHTNYSYDGYNSFAGIYRECRKMKMKAICITDHDTIKGGLAFVEWLKKWKKNDLEVVLGVEITCSDGTHIIGLFVHKEIVSGLTPPSVVNEIKSQGGFVYFPHPSRKDGILNSKYADEVLSQGDFYEIFNGKVNNAFNKEAANFFANKYPRIKPLAGSDAHYNADLRKAFCALNSIREYETVREYLDSYKRNEVTVSIYGFPKTTSGNNYFNLYYENKEKIKLPGWIKSIAKRVFPLYKNLKERNKAFGLTLINPND